MYVAIEEDFFEDEGIDINLVLTSGADKVTAAVLSGDAQIGFSGSEATIYVYNAGEKDYLRTLFTYQLQILQSGYSKNSSRWKVP